MPNGTPFTTNFKTNNGTDLGDIFVEKECLLNLYPDIYNNYIKDIEGHIWGDGANSGGAPVETCYTVPCRTFFNGTDWKSVSTGLNTLSGNNFVVVKNDGTLWSWGANSYGRFGNNSVGETSSSPVQTISGGSNWKFVTTSGWTGTVAAIKTDGTLWLWGSGAYGILGNNDISNQCSPVQTLTAGTWKTISLGSGSAAAIKSDGTLWTWGNNSGGKLGDNSTTCRSSPVQTSSGGTTWCAASFGRCHLMALKSDNTLWTVGCGLCGSLGDNILLSSRSQPVQISGTTWCFISAGNCLSAAVKTDGTLWTWGTNNPVGQLGINTSIGSRCSPVQTSSGGTTWKKVFLGSQNSVFAVKSDLSLWTWGCNQFGKLGIGDTSNRSCPVKISNGWTDISAGELTTIGIRSQELYLCNVTNIRFTDSSGQSYDLDDVYVRTCCYSEAGVWVWGNNFKCRLSISDGVARSSPIQSANLNSNDWKIIVSDKTTYTGSGNFGGGGAGIKTDGTLWLWGSEAFGKLGNGICQDNTPFKVSPVQTISQGTWKQVSRGDHTTGGIKTDGTLWMWGLNISGIIGNLTNLDGGGSALSFCSPVQTVAQGTNWCQISVWGHAGAIKQDGTLWLWGDNFDGQLGVGTSGTNTSKSSPVQTISQGNNWCQISVGFAHTVATKTDGSLWVWGCNRCGRLGDGTTINKSSPVQTISQGNNWKTVSAGYLTTAAIKTDSSLWMWGSNSNGELANNSVNARSSPIQVGTDTVWRDISLGPTATGIGGSIGTMAASIKHDGTLWTWGLNQCGVLGDTQTVCRSSPAQTLVGGNNWKSVSAGTGVFALRDHQNC